MLPVYVEVASRTYRVLWLLENVLREYLETGNSSIVMTVPTTKEEAVSALQEYITELQRDKSHDVQPIDAAKTKPSRPLKPPKGEESLKSMQREVDKLDKRDGLPPPSTAISRKGRPLDFVFLRFLSHALNLRNPDLHRHIADELETLNAYRNAIMHFRDVGPDGFDHACSLTWRICHALGQDEHCGPWIGQWFGTAADPKRFWPRILGVVSEGREPTCIDYGDFAVPPVGRFRPVVLQRDGCVLFPGGLYKTRSSWIRLDPAWVAKRAVSVRCAGADRLIDSREYESWIVPEVEAATIDGDEAIGPSGLRFFIGGVERRQGTSSAQTGFMVSDGDDGVVISDGIPAGHGDLIRTVSNMAASPVDSR
jgi:hypothetical protein